jgi:hypothetical protein
MGPDKGKDLLAGCLDAELQFYAIEVFKIGLTF